MRVQPYPGDNAAIERIAGRLRAHVEGLVDAGASPASLLRKLVSLTGGEIKVAEDPSGQEVNGGSLVIRGPHDYTVYLSPYTTPLRDNFTIAHELGHYVLHFHFAKPRPELPLWFARYGSSPFEWQANRFAAAILMPEEQFRKLYEQSDENLRLLSGYFDVSQPAVEVRAKSLGLREE